MPHLVPTGRSWRSARVVLGKRRAHGGQIGLGVDVQQHARVVKIDGGGRIPCQQAACAALAFQTDQLGKQLGGEAL